MGCGGTTLSFGRSGSDRELFRGRVRLFSLEGAAGSGWLAVVGLAHAEYVTALWLGNWRWELQRPSSGPRPLLTVTRHLFVRQPHPREGPTSPTRISNRPPSVYRRLTLPLRGRSAALFAPVPDPHRAPRRDTMKRIPQR